MAEDFEDAVEKTDELTLLKERADLMGIKYHPSIGIDTLKEKINLQLKVKDPVEQTIAVTPQNKKYSKEELASMRRTQLRNDALRLIRVRVTCMNPNKKAWSGALFDVGNSVLGSVKKFVPFDVDAGYHIPNIIYEHMKTRKYQKFSEVKLPNGRKMMKGGLVKEFSIDVLDPLTPEQLKELADRQILNHSIDA